MSTLQANLPQNSPALSPPHAQTCPWCDSTLDAAMPNECPRCDWIRKHPAATGAATGTVRDRAAIVLSIVPGLGHIYKGHRLLGAILMLGSVFAAFACLLAGFASAGWGVLLLPIYWAGVMLHVFWLEDLGSGSLTHP